MEYAEYLKSEHWMERRKAALKWWDSKCALCNGNGELHVHHRSYANLGQEPLSDLVVLCKSCHELFHNKITKEPGEIALETRQLMRLSTRELIETRLLHSLLFHLIPYDEHIIPALRQLSFDMFSSEGRKNLVAVIADTAEAASRGVDVCYQDIEEKLATEEGRNISKCLVSVKRPPDSDAVLSGCIKKLSELIAREKREKIRAEGGDSLEVAKKLMKIRKEKARVLLGDVYGDRMEL
jgi:hypothetical protein